MRFSKLPRWLFKRYDDSHHWGLFIPVSRKKVRALYDAANETLRDPAPYRLHFIITVKWDRFHCLRMRELRIRFGYQYL